MRPNIMPVKLRGGHLGRAILVWLVVTVLLLAQSTHRVYAETDCSDPDAVSAKMVGLEAPLYDPCSGETTGECSVSSSIGSNLDYAGRPVFTQAQLKAIGENQSFYEKAASQVNIPWQMIAVIHVRETGLSRANPSNGQGIYQFVDKHGGPYPEGKVSDDEFLRQTRLAAEFIKGKAAGNYDGHKDLNSGSDSEVIKDTFFGYNGRASAYEAQAASLGFTKTQGYEGSPYVMNKADAKRDPDKNPTKWGQIKVDGGGIEYPANGDYGAFVQYAALTGSDLGSGCGTVSGPVSQKVVTLARQELQLWENGKLKPGSDFHKYSQNRDENWCADFVSWIYNKAGYPLKSGNEGNVPSVDEVRHIGETSSKFDYHPSARYTPKPGDIIIQKNNSTGLSHVMLVISVSGKTMTVIGGNQGSDGRGFTASRVSQYDITGFASNDIVGYVTPEGS